MKDDIRPFRKLYRAICAAAVDNDDLVWIVRTNRLQRRFDTPFLIQRRDNHRDGHAFPFVSARRIINNVNDPWYQDGLRFRCTQCGSCCTGAPGYVWVTDEEVEDIARHRGESPVETLALHTRMVGRKRSLKERPNGDCIFYDQKQGCTIYPARPRQCRTWPFWESNVVTQESWQRTCEICPGSGKGDLISAEEITQKLQVIRL